MSEEQVLRVDDEARENVLAVDHGFVAAALAKGCRLDHFADTQGLCLHILRKDNMSKSFPQYLLPDFMLEKLFAADLAPLLEG